MKHINEYINEAAQTAVMYFKTITPLYLYGCVFKYEITEGEWGNEKPKTHKNWVKRTDVVYNPDGWYNYTGREHTKKYPINNWLDTAKGKQQEGLLHAVSRCARIIDWDPIKEDALVILEYLRPFIEKIFVDGNGAKNKITLTEITEQIENDNELSKLYKDHKAKIDEIFVNDEFVKNYNADRYNKKWLTDNLFNCFLAVNDKYEE